MFQAHLYATLATLSGQGLDFHTLLTTSACPLSLCKHNLQLQRSSDDSTIAPHGNATHSTDGPCPAACNVPSGHLRVCRMIQQVPLHSRHIWTCAPSAHLLLVPVVVLDGDAGVRPVVGQQHTFHLHSAAFRSGNENAMS